MLRLFRFRSKQRVHLVQTRNAVPHLINVLSTEIALLSKIIQQREEDQEPIDSTASSMTGDETQVETEETEETKKCDQTEYPLKRLGRVLAAVSQVHLKLKVEPFQREKFVLVKYLRPFSRTDETFGDNVRAIARSIEASNCSEIAVAHYTELMNLYIYLKLRIEQIN